MIVHIVDEQDDPLKPGFLETIAVATMTAEGLPETTEVGLTLTDESAMAALNEDHLGKPGPTDVLSFPLDDLTPGVPVEVVADGPPPFLGDIFICPAVVARNAAAEQVPFEDEMALMVVHGLLHLLGYDHVVDVEAEHMEQREREVLADLGRVRP